MSKKKVAVLVSGGGTNLQALIDDEIPIDLVISSKQSAYALTRASENKIKTEIAEWSEYKPDRIAYSRKILEILEYNEIDLVVYAGFLVILDDCIIKAYPDAMINVHPSLIPAFSGEGMYGLRVHQAALERGVKISGATVHFVNEICDGGKIILQDTVEVLPGDTPETLQARVMEVEREILPRAVRLLCGIESEEFYAADEEIQTTG
jgi:phosphoribosylglycinamide formyltransferase-1